MATAATMAVIDMTYQTLRNRYQALLRRGARAEFQQDMDYIRQQLDSIENAWPELINNPGRLYDVVVSVGTRIKPKLDKIESKYGEGTRVGPGHFEAGLPESSMPKIAPGELLFSAPVGIGNKKGRDIIQPFSPWFYVSGVDLRIVGGVVAGLVVLTVGQKWFQRRRGRRA